MLHWVNLSVLAMCLEHEDFETCSKLDKLFMHYVITPFCPYYFRNCYCGQEGTHDTHTYHWAGCRKTQCCLLEIPLSMTLASLWISQRIALCRLCSGTTSMSTTLHMTTL